MRENEDKINKTIIPNSCRLSDDRFDVNPISGRVVVSNSFGMVLDNELIDT